jgi:hypothetical protein
MAEKMKKKRKNHLKQIMELVAFILLPLNPIRLDQSLKSNQLARTAYPS